MKITESLRFYLRCFCGCHMLSVCLETAPSVAVDTHRRLFSLPLISLTIVPYRLAPDRVVPTRDSPTNVCYKSL